MTKEFFAYTTIDGDELDAICHQYYGTSKGTTELVLEANPHLLKHPYSLPAGIKITLPPISPEPKRHKRLW